MGGMTIAVRRLTVSATGLRGDANIRRRHPAEAAAWVWHPARRGDETAFLDFACDFACERDGIIVIHVTADHRFQLALDGVEVGYGPDRGEPMWWSVASYELRVPAGRHRLTALVWWIADGAPVAQMSVRGGFLLAAEGDWQARLSTGSGPWTVVDRTAAVTLSRPAQLHYHVIGPGFTVDAARWAAGPAPVAPTVVQGPVVDSDYGGLRAGWRLEGASLPEQRRELVGGGRVRALQRGPDGPVREGAGADLTPWQALVDGRGTVTVPPGTTLAALWDLGEYRCGYPVLAVEGGAGARIAVEWAEALYAAPRAAEAHPHVPKGRRNEVDGKVFLGFGDTLVADGAARTLPAFWWRSGRFLRIVVATTDAPLTLTRLAVRTTGYPFAEECAFASSDPGLDATLPLLVRGLRMSGHETWVDCPYYEQLQYVGDTRLEALASYVLGRDDRLARQAIIAFDRSRWSNGFAAERAPSGELQASTTYAMLWPLMVADHLAWRGDRAFARERLTGLRSQLEHLLPLIGADHLLGAVPGWSFVDWVPGWHAGMGPGVRDGGSAIVNLHLVLSLQATAQVERAVGEAVLADRCERLAQATARALVARWWDEGRGLLADADGRERFSEHAQSLAIIAGVLDPARERRCADAWLASTDLAPASIYFSFYPLEALWRLGRGDELVRRLAFWKDLLAQGFTTPPEAPEPSRSDCHGWGSHPLWHLGASLAGIRPLDPGFARVLVAPQPGPLTTVRMRLPHPAGGDIAVEVTRDGGGWRAVIDLPGVGGVFRFAGIERDLRAGRNEVRG